MIWWMATAYFAGMVTAIGVFLASGRVQWRVEAELLPMPGEERKDA